MSEIRFRKFYTSSTETNTIQGSVNAPSIKNPEGENRSVEIKKDGKPRAKSFLEGFISKSLQHLKSFFERNISSSQGKAKYIQTIKPGPTPTNKTRIDKLSANIDKLSANELIRDSNQLLRAPNTPSNNIEIAKYRSAIQEKIFRLEQDKKYFEAKREDLPGNDIGKIDVKMAREIIQLDSITKEIDKKQAPAPAPKETSVHNQPSFENLQSLSNSDLLSKGSALSNQAGPTDTDVLKNYQTVISERIVQLKEQHDKIPEKGSSSLQRKLLGTQIQKLEELHSTLAQKVE